MRDILFRGKDDESGKFIYGYYGLERDMRKKIPFILKPSIAWEEDGILFSSFVIPETVGQFTGLADKNGTKIFEGDIVRRTCININFDYIVKYNIDLGEFELEFIKDGGSLAMFHGIDGEVIGNIYDNPELLKKEKE